MELSVSGMVQSGELVFVGVIRDISERKRAEERQALLAAELDHRAKNMVALGQAIVRQTARSDRGGVRTSDACHEAVRLASAIAVRGS